jgi:hypothetical protein
MGTLEREEEIQWDLTYFVFAVLGPLRLGTCVRVAGIMFQF